LLKTFPVGLNSTSCPGRPTPARLKKAGVLADAGGLLHVVRDDDDGEALPELHHQVLDRQRRDRVERRARLVQPCAS